MRDKNDLKEAKELLNKISFKDYGDLNSRSGSDEGALEKIKSKIKETNSELLFLALKETPCLSEKALKRLPQEVLRFKKFSEYRGINYYILKQQEEILKVFVGVYGGTTGRANDDYMQEILQDPEIQKKVRRIELSYQDLLENEESLL